MIARGERKLIEIPLARVDSDAGVPDLAALLPDLSVDDGGPLECSVDCGVLPGVDPTRVRCFGARCDVTGACLSGRGHCSTVDNLGCEADFTSAATCGSCTLKCSGAMPFCTSGSCTASCGGATPQQCGSSCVSFEDPRTCGGCDMRCDPAPGYLASCDGGKCSFTCAPDTIVVMDSCVQWAQQTTAVSSTFYSVYATSPSYWLAGSEQGLLFSSYGNDVWNSRTLGLPGDLTGIWGTPTDLSITDSAGRIYHSADGTNFTSDFVSGTGLWGISGNGDRVFAVSPTDIYERRNMTWASIHHLDSITLFGVWVANDDVIAVGNANVALPPAQQRIGLVQRQSNGLTNEYPSVFSLFGVWGTSSDNFWVVGRSGMIIRRMNNDWLTEHSSGADLLGVGGSGPDDVYAVGADGTILHSTGNGTWTPQASGVSTHLRAVFGIVNGSTRIVHAVGDSGVILRKL